MPRQTDLRFTGRIGNLIFYKIDETYYMRGAPGKIKQTAATKKRSTEFGKASRTGSRLRRQLFPVIPFPKDNKMQTRLVTALYTWFRKGYDPLKPCVAVPFLERYQFTEESSIKERWWVDLQVSQPATNMLELKIPAFVPTRNIIAPAGTKKIKCVIATAGCNVETGAHTHGTSTTILYDYNQLEVPEQIVSLPTPTPKGSLVVTAVGLEFICTKGGYFERVIKKGFHPSGILSAMYF